MSLNWVAGFQHNHICAVLDPTPFHPTYVAGGSWIARRIDLPSIDYPNFRTGLNMQTVLDAQHFTIVVPDRPHVSRPDGGHMIIRPKVAVVDRTQLTREQAVELMKLTMVAGAAMHAVLNRRGIDIWRINYQDNGNWRPELHVHLYGRAKSSKMQPYGYFLTIPPTPQAFKQQADLEPLNAEDVAELRAEIERLLATEKYRNF